MLNDCVAAHLFCGNLSTLPLLIDFRKRITAYLDDFEDEVEVHQSWALSTMPHPLYLSTSTIVIEAIEMDRALFEGRVINLYLAIQILTFHSCGMYRTYSTDTLWIRSGCECCVESRPFTTFPLQCPRPNSTSLRNKISDNDESNPSTR